VSKYFEILKYSLEVYLKDGDKKPDIFYLALHNISDNIGRDVYSLRDYHENEIDYSQAYRKIGAYYSGILSLIDYVNAKPDFFPYEIRFESENYSYTSDHNIFGALADGIYRAIQVLSRKPSLYEMERRLLAEIYLMWDRGSMALRSIQDRLDILLSEEIGGRLRDKLYSTLSAGLIYSFGLYEPEKARCNIHKLLLNALKKNYIKKHSLNPDAAQKMLPMDTKFDKVSKKLIRIDPNQWFEDQRVQELTLEQEV
jgi:hypothetical protein